MIVVGISGSPRKGGNTDILLDAALDGARIAGATCEKIAVRDLDFEGCRECGGCRKNNGSCAVKDDMTLIYKKIARADRLIIASPIFFGSLTGILKMFIDRFECFWIAREICSRPVPVKEDARGIFLCVAEEKKMKYFTNARQIVRFFFRTAGIEYCGGAYFSGVSGKGDILKKKEAIKKGFSLGASLVKT